MQDDTFFTGGVFSDRIDGGRCGADIELTHDAVKATTKDGRYFSVRYADCQLDVGGYNNRMIFCRNEDRSLTVFCEDNRFPAALTYAAGGLLDDQLEEKQQKVRAKNRQSRNLMLGLATASLIVVVALYFGVRAAGSAAVRAVPVSVDQRIGEEAYKMLDLGGPEVKDEVIVSAVEAIVERLAPHAALQGLDYEVHVVESPQVNAFALPGGVIVVFTGLLERAEQPEQVAGVLAHEIAHATLRHGLERIGQSVGLATAANLLLGNVEGIVVIGSELFQLATINSYSRDQETAADLEGVRMLHAAGIDPLGLAQFFEILKEEGNELPAGLEWISTHPDHDARIMSIRGAMGAMEPKKYQPLDVDWASVKEHVQADRDL